MSTRLLQVVAAVLAALVVGLAAFWHPEPAPRDVSPARQPAGGDFTLASADGPVSLVSLRGKVVLIYFGYTFCPDICPTSLAATADGLRQLKPDEMARVAMLFVSVDPERDTPAHLKEYVAFFHPAIVGVTGSAAEIGEIARHYGAFYAKQKVETAGGGYVVDHTSDTYVVGPAGQLLGRIAHDTPAPRVAAEIRQYLQQNPNP